MTRRTLFLSGTGRANASQIDGALVPEPGKPAVYRHIHDPRNPVRADEAVDGAAVRLGSGWTGVLRTRYRNDPARSELMRPDETTLLRVNLLEIVHTLNEGHRLRLSVFSSAFPFISVNPNTGEDIATDSAPPRIARQTVFHGGSHPSTLTLDVLEGGHSRDGRTPAAENA